MHKFKFSLISRWQSVNIGYACAFKDHLYQLKQETKNSISVKVQSFKCSLCKNGDTAHTNKFIERYFSDELYRKTSIRKIVPKNLFDLFDDNTKGLRLLEQDKFENILSFICSANNNVKRISSMVKFLANTFGAFEGEIQGEKFYSFPIVEDFKAQEETTAILLENKFGYRASRISQAVDYIASKGSKSYLENLSALDYQNAFEELCKIPGVGSKVADCICLMSLKHYKSVPIDTHMFQVAQRDYGFKLNAKTFTPKEYRRAKELFQNEWGQYSGVVQLVILFKDFISINLCLKSVFF